MRGSGLGVSLTCRNGRALAFVALTMFGTVTAHALPLSSLKDQGLDHIFGSYAQDGDCSREPRVVIDEAGMTFRANGRNVTPQRIEHALTFLGQSYGGITSVFFPFPVSTNDYGRVIMFVNDGEKPGFIRFDSDLPPGHRPDPFHAAFTNARPC